MKLQIINNENESIEGFVSLKISENFQTTLSQIVNNSYQILIYSQKPIQIH
jgi:hypothetical protein